MHTRSKWLGGVGAVIVAAMLLAGPVQPAEACSATDSFLGAICYFPFDFCPKGWVKPEGQLLLISQNQALYTKLGTTYGGDGQTTFALPDLRSRIFRGTGQGPGLDKLDLGDAAGTESTVMTIESMPAHNHGLLATNVVGDKPGPSAKVLARVNPDDGSILPYNSTLAAMPDAILAPSSIGSTGNVQPVPIPIRPPTMGTTFCIALQGIYPR
jgi:microcystin-dependent protein